MPTHTAPYDARLIARWFIEWAHFDDEAALTNLKLQKLLYYAKGHFTAANDGRPLFRNPMQAWSHGPVVPDVYHLYKKFGGNPIEPDGDFDFSQVDEDTTEWLAAVWRTFGSQSAWKLREMTHTESPWVSTFREDGRSIVIDDGALMDYFEKFYAGTAQPRR